VNPVSLPRRFAIVAIWLAVSSVVCAQPSPDDTRYRAVEKMIKRNRHISGHLVLAVDARTIAALRNAVSANDVDVLVRLMGHKDYGVASAASGLLVTLGDPAAPALEAASRSPDPTVAAHARDGLRLLADCHDPALRNVMNPAVCPADRPTSRPPVGRR